MKARRNQRFDPPSNGVDHIAAFFAGYPAFAYDPSVPFMDGFLDMCDQFQWREDDAERKDALRALQDAMVRKFNDLYGVSADELWAWQRLCRAIGIAPVSNSLRDCRSVCGPHPPPCTSSSLRIFDLAWYRYTC